MNFLSKTMSQITPYTAGEQPKDKKYIKLNTNENPYPPTKKIAEILKNYSLSDLKLYPDTEAVIVKNALAKKLNVAASQIFIGNGSDEVLALAFKAFFNPHAEDIVFPDISYSFYPVFAGVNEINYRQIPLSGDYLINAEDYTHLLSCQGIVLANPNAPTGTLLSESEIERIVSTNLDKLVIVDEAYIDFAKTKSALNLIQKYENVLVVQTFSKSYALAGIRCGYAIGNEKLIDGLKRARDSFNSYPVDRLCAEIAAAAASDTSYYETVTNAVIDTRNKTISELRSLGFFVTDSSSNFVFATHKGISAEKLYLSLKDKGILVRYFKKPRIDNFLRITIGTPNEMKALYDEISNIIK